MKKTALKLIPAAAMLLVSAIMVSTATFAWFSMNTTVNVTGMSLTAVTPANLVISETGAAGTWSNSLDINLQNINGKLFPASSDTGSTGQFNAVTDGNYIKSGAGGVAEASTAFLPTASVGQLSSTGQANNTGYWAEYNFKLTLSEEQALAVNVYLSKLVIADTSTAESNGESITDIDGAVRVALFVDGALNAIYANANAKSESYVAIGGTIEAVTEYANLDSSKKVTMRENTDYFRTDVNGDIAEDEDNLFQVSGAAVKDITIVVWIEGQDPACKNTATGRSFSVDLDFSVSDTPVV